MLLVIIIIGIFNKPRIALNDAVELNTVEPRLIIISDTREKSYYIEPVEIEQLFTILDSLEMKKKVIPNVQAFNMDAYIIMNPITIKFDFERNIIGIIKENQTKMEQFILEDDSELVSFVQSYFQ